jgi:hypothetical protein
MLIAVNTPEISNKKGLQPNGHEREQLSFLKHTSLRGGLPTAALHGVIQTPLCLKGIP